jgi:hypothetical protein
VGRPPGQPLPQSVSCLGQKNDARTHEQMSCSTEPLLQGTGAPPAFVFALWQSAPCHVGRYSLMLSSQFWAQ